MGEFTYDYVGLDAEIGARLRDSASDLDGVGADVPAKGAVGSGREPEHGLHHGKRESSENEKSV